MNPAGSPSSQTANMSVGIAVPLQQLHPHEAHSVTLSKLSTQPDIAAQGDNEDDDASSVDSYTTAPTPDVQRATPKQQGRNWKKYLSENRINIGLGTVVCGFGIASYVAQLNANALTAEGIKSGQKANAIATAALETQLWEDCQIHIELQNATNCRSFRNPFEPGDRMNLDDVLKARDFVSSPRFVVLQSCSAGPVSRFFAEDEALTFSHKHLMKCMLTMKNVSRLPRNVFVGLIACHLLFVAYPLQLRRRLMVEVRKLSTAEWINLSIGIGLILAFYASIHSLTATYLIGDLACGALGLALLAILAGSDIAIKRMRNQTTTPLDEECHAEREKPIQSTVIGELLSHFFKLCKRTLVTLGLRSNSYLKVD